MRASGPGPRGLREAGGGGRKRAGAARSFGCGARPRRVPAGGGARGHHPTGGGAPGPGAQPRRSLAWAAQPSCQPMWRGRAGMAAV